MQKYRSYLKENKAKLTPKQLILQDFASFITKWTVENINSSIIVRMDANNDTKLTYTSRNVC